MVTRRTRIVDDERRIQAERRSIVAAMHAKGKKDIQIAAALGITVPQARHIRQRMGLKSRYRAYLEKVPQGHNEEEPFDADEVDLCALVWGLKADGFSVEDIALRAAKPVEEVERVAKKMPKAWRAMGNGRDCLEFMGATYTRTLRGSRRGGGKKMLPDDYRN